MVPQVRSSSWLIHSREAENASLCFFPLLSHPNAFLVENKPPSPFQTFPHLFWLDWRRPIVVGGKIKAARNCSTAHAQLGMAFALSLSLGLPSHENLAVGGISSLPKAMCGATVEEAEGEPYLNKVNARNNFLFHVYTS